MGAFDFLNRRESAHDTLGEFAFDDIDMLLSERDGSLIPVAVSDGVHVCQMCGKQFVGDPASPKRMVEFNCGGHGVRIGIHACCVNKASKKLRQRGENGEVLFDMAERHQARRFLTRATKAFRKRDAG
jgi:hypothetical protein